MFGGSLKFFWVKNLYVRNIDRPFQSLLNVCIFCVTSNDYFALKCVSMLGIHKKTRVLWETYLSTWYESRATIDK